MSKRMIIMLLAVSLVFGAIFGFKWFGNRMMNQFFDTMEQPAASITVSEVSSAGWQPRTEAVGNLRAVSGAELATEVGGIVREVAFANGQRVQAGDLLVRLDTSTDEAELASLEAALRLSEQELERQQRLFGQQSISRAELDQRQSQADQARAQVQAQRARIEQKRLHAPFDGIAGIRQVNPGQFVSPGTPLVSLQALDPIHVEFSVSERLLSRLDVGNTVKLRVDAWPEESFQGAINAIEPRIRESTRTVMVQAKLDNPQEMLRPGMFARVELSLGDVDDVLVVPQTAIRFSPYGNSVFVLKRNGDDALSVEQRFVRTGETRGDLIAINEGVELGEQVASSGLLKLQNGSRVTINDDPNLQPSAEEDPRPANR